MRWLRQLFCGHHNTETQYFRSHYFGEWVLVYWHCHDCGKTRGEKPREG